VYLLRARAVSALTALLALAAGAAHAADCAALAGTYQDKATDEQGPRVGDLALGRDRQRLVREEARGTARAFGSGGLLKRPKVTPLAATVTLVPDTAGMRFRFADASGRTLLESRLDAPKKWACVDGRLTRSDERMSGNASGIRTERIEESMAREGDVLVLTETATVIEPVPGKPVRRWIHPRAAGR
jgi:hypothetical protein